MIYRGAILICLCISGCATQYPECHGDKECIADAQEYDRVEHIEEFKIKVRNCELKNGHLYYSGPYGARMKRILDKKDWDSLRKLETIHFGCSK